jgi:hypothetical protein
MLVALLIAYAIYILIYKYYYMLPIDLIIYIAIYYFLVALYRRIVNDY